MYIIYCLVSEKKDKTYTGFTDNQTRRELEHRNGKVKTTKNFGNFILYVLEENIDDVVMARKRERYWKSAVGRRKIRKNIFNN